MSGPSQHPVRLDVERGRLTPETSEHLPGRGSEWLSDFEDHSNLALFESQLPHRISLRSGPEDGKRALQLGYRHVTIWFSHIIQFTSFHARHRARFSVHRSTEEVLDTVHPKRIQNPEWGRDRI